MLKNYFKIALRNLVKNKLHSSINILGLAIGFMVAILSILFIKSEWETDKWLAKSDQTYRAYRNWGQGAGGWVGMPVPFAQTLVNNIPGVEKATHLDLQENILFTAGDKAIYVEQVAFVDSIFFQFFDFPFAHGDSKTAMNQQTGLVISEDMAKKFFGDANPIGQILKMDGSLELEVTGVLKETGQHSHLKYDLYARLDETNNNQWLNYSLATYIQKTPNTRIQDIEEQTIAVVKPIIIDAWKRSGENFDPKNMANWRFQAFNEIYLNSNNLGFKGQQYGNSRSLKIFGLIAFFVLFIATVNYMNLSTARAAGRAKEVGMRKVSGARKSQLVVQFLAESMIQSMLALSIAFVLAEFVLPVFNQITDRDLSFFGGNWMTLLLPLIVIGLLVGFLAGTYPAFILSAFEPIKVLKGNVLKNASGQIFRKFLVVTQFAISVVLIIVMLFIFKQVKFMQSQELGFNGAQVVNIAINNYASNRLFNNRKSDFLTIPGVLTATSSSQLPGDISGGMTIDIEGRKEMTGAPMVLVSPDYEKTIGLEMVKGRFFSSEIPNDTARAIVVNETFLKQFKIEDPLSARMKLFGETEYSNIVGVVKDFHTSGLQYGIPPVFFAIRPNWGYSYVSFKIAPTNIPNTLAAIEKKWSAIEPLHPVRFTFLDEDFARQYAAHENFGQTMLFATGLSILIAILGLFGLASFMAEQRTKEIGIRKVLGASVQNLLNLLVKDFVVLVLIAGIIAVPFGHWLVKEWLKDFAYTTTIDALPFVVAITGALVLAILTVSYQSIKVSAANPIEALKNE